MIQYRNIQVPAREPVSVTCNKCGAIWATDQYPDFTTIQHLYGYNSKKDMVEYVSHVCEPCMDEFYATFKIKPEIVQPYEPVDCDDETA